MEGYQLGKDIQHIRQSLEALGHTAGQAVAPEERSLLVGPLEAYADLEKIPIEECDSKRGTFTAYAPPLFWGPWQKISSHGGSITYTIKYGTVGSTKVIGRVRYVSDEGTITQDFVDFITFTTGNVWANVEVRFKGIPFGSAVRGFIDP